MTNSYEWYLLGLFNSILSDAVSQYHIEPKEIKRDYSRLVSLVQTRGLSVFTLDLPALGKQFDRCLANEHLSLSGPLSRRAKKSEAYPRLFKGMLRRVFAPDGSLRTDADARSVKLLRQLYYAGKKLHVPCTDSKTYQAVSEFIDIEKELRLPSLNWTEDELAPEQARDLSFTELFACKDDHPLLPFGIEDGEPSSSRQLAEYIQRSADIIAAQLGRFDPSEWRFAHGPGAVSDQKRYSDKYRFPHWPQKLETVYKMAEFAFANHLHWVAHVQALDDAVLLVQHEPPSKLIVVPKTAKGPRLICSEPVAHQWCQQTIKDYVSKRISSTVLASCVSFDNQKLSQAAALSASRDGSSMTIDLSSASDRLSLWIVERMFRSNPTLLSALHACRTRWLINNIDKKLPKYLILKKFAPMGSACTFPIQTVVYGCVSLACLAYARRLEPTICNLRKLAKEVRIFGDDIIVPKDCGTLVTGALQDLGFKVNADKTYGTGLFRESCGCDAWSGHDVTPSYVLTRPERARPESVISSVEACWNFFEKNWHAASEFIKSTTQTVASLKLPSGPCRSGPLKWPTGGWLEFPSRKRWNQTLHRMEYLTSVPIGKQEKVPTYGSTSLLQYFTESPSPDDFWMAGVGLRSRLHLKSRWEPLFDLSNS